jgi:hypothetical protein
MSSDPALEILPEAAEASEMNTDPVSRLMRKNEQTERRKREQRKMEAFGR